MKDPKVGGRSPWGTIQTVETIVPGHIWDVSTASHGGIKLDPEYNRLVDPRWRAKGGWYEEDVEAAVAMISFQRSFDMAFARYSRKVNWSAVRSSLARYYPKEYAEWWPYERSVESQRGKPYDAAEIAEEARKAKEELAAMFPEPRRRKPQRIFTSKTPRGVYIQVDPGDMVVCDACNRDMTDDPTPGGFIFAGHAYCPYCAEEALKRIKKHGEEEFITHVAPVVGISFAEWIRKLRAEGEV